MQYTREEISLFQPETKVMGSTVMLMRFRTSYSNCNNVDIKLSNACAFVQASRGLFI